MTPLRFGWVGFHMEGLAAFEALLEGGAPLVGAVTLTPERAARRSGAADYGPVCRRHGVPLHQVADINAPESVALLRSLDLDILFVIGWCQILRPPALATTRIGAIGAHASLLPKGKGSAPVNWAIIRGLHETGNSLIWLADEVDAGALIDQSAFCITPYDTCATVYQRVAESNRDMLLRLLPRLLAGERPGGPQPPMDAPLLPRRRPDDGRIDWRASGRAIYDFVRGLTRPYPGAFSWMEGRRWTVWNAAWLPLPDTSLGPPGRVLGPVYSPAEGACGQLVACGRGAVTLIEVEAEDGERLTGRALSERAWAERTWTDG